MSPHRTPGACGTCGGPLGHECPEAKRGVNWRDWRGWWSVLSLLVAMSLASWFCWESFAGLAKPMTPTPSSPHHYGSYPPSTVTFSGDGGSGDGGSVVLDGVNMVIAPGTTVDLGNVTIRGGGSIVVKGQEKKP